MNNAQTSQTEPNGSIGTHDIRDVRRQIDVIDSALAALIAQRCALSASVASAKKAAGDQAFGWRPAREIDILRQVLAREASLDPELAFVVWRALISANLAAQGELRILAVAETIEAAKAAFSVGTLPILIASSADLLAALVNDDHAIGVLPWPDGQDWWVIMMEARFEALHVCAASPLAGGQPEVLLIAKRAPEAAGEDISLIAGPIGVIDGGVLASIGDFELVACGEFIGAEADLPRGCRLIGSFALA